MNSMEDSKYRMRHAKDVQFLLEKREFKSQFAGKKSEGAILTRISFDVQQVLLDKFLSNEEFYIEDEKLKFSELNIRQLIMYNSEELIVDENGYRRFKDEVGARVREAANSFLRVRDKKSESYDDNNVTKELEQARLLTQLEYDEHDDWKLHVKSVDGTRPEVLDRSYIIPLEGLEYSSFIYNLSITSQGRYIYNPRIKLARKTLLKENGIQHVVVKIVGEIPIIERLPIKGAVFCPKCRKKSEFYYFELNGDKFKCKNNVLGDEICANSLAWKSAEVMVSKDLYFYQVMLTTEEGKKFGHTRICSSICKLMPGIHNVQLIVRNLSEGGILIIAKNFYDVDQQEKFLDFTQDADSAEKYKWFLEKRGLWDHNMFFINYKIREMIKSRAHIAIQDNSTIIALSMLLQAFDRMYGNLIEGDSAMIHLLAIADSGTGKSFVSMIYGGVLFPRFLYVENSLRMSMPGMTGGMQEIFVGDRVKKLFTYGLFSEHDYIVFNEAMDRIATKDGRDIAEFFKSILDAKQASANVMGGRPVPREASVCLVGNISNKDISEYSKAVKEEYQQVYNELDQQGLQIERYNPKWPLMTRMPRFKLISNELYEVHKSVRNNFVLNYRRDFAIDVGIPLMRRFPFYFRAESLLKEQSFEGTNREAHLTKTGKDINEFVDANRIQKELLAEFPVLPITDAQRHEIYDYLDIIMGREDMMKRKFSADVLLRILRIMMCINKETHISESTKKLFEFLVVEPSLDFISEDHYNCVKKREDLEDREIEEAEQRNSLRQRAKAEINEMKKQGGEAREDEYLSSFADKDV